MMVLITNYSELYRQMSGKLIVSEQVNYVNCFFYNFQRIFIKTNKYI